MHHSTSAPNRSHVSQSSSFTNHGGVPPLNITSVPRTAGPPSALNTYRNPAGSTSGRLITSASGSIMRPTSSSASASSSGGADALPIARGVSLSLGSNRLVSPPSPPP